MKINLSNSGLSQKEKLEVANLLKRQSDKLDSDLEQMWFLMDLVWDEYSCDNTNLNWEKIGLFYSDSVWLLNGLFLEQDTDSMSHRYSIRDWVIGQDFKSVVDYGGGFGTLARLIASTDSNIDVSIYEPHPSDFGLKRANEYANIKIVSDLVENYDCILSTDVLEHVPDPLLSFSEMIGSLKGGGVLIVANCFYPVIKCHLPNSFHFRYTFNIFARVMGLKVVGNLDGSHATIFKKISNKDINWKLVRFLEKISKRIFLPLEGIKLVLSSFKTYK